jgi:hypothetical protein
VLAWIVTRNPKVVEDFAPDKEKRPMAKWVQIFEDAAEQKFKAAFNEMKYRAQKGQLPAKGCPWYDRDGEQGDRCQIEASHWGAGADLWDQLLRTKQQTSLFGVPYVEEWAWVWFDRASVLRLWPDPDTPPTAAPASTAAPVSTETPPASTAAPVSAAAPVSKEEDKREPSPIQLLAEWIYPSFAASLSKRQKSSRLHKASESYPNLRTSNSTKRIGWSLPPKRINHRPQAGH